MAVIFGFSARSTIPKPPGLTPEVISNLGHFSVYFVLAIVLWWGLDGWNLSPSRRLVIAFVIAVGYGVSDEWHQSFVPGRTPDIRDLAVDAAGAICGLLAARWVARHVAANRFW
jgi:VanZ family protein